MVKVGIIGASGYTGAELIRLLTNHRKVEVTYVTSETYKGKQVSQLSPNLIGISSLKFKSFKAEEAKKLADVLFVALPHGKPMKVIPRLLAKNKKIIDLSGDFRLASQAKYKKWYGTNHTSANLLRKAVYGLPEVNRASIKKASFITNPGCYPTSVLLALAPVLKKKLIFTQDIIVDSLSGMTGAGRTPSSEVHFCTVAENVSSYKVGGVHQHIPEMEQEMTKIAGEEVKISFTPHLAPFLRGIYSTIYADLKPRDARLPAPEVADNGEQEGRGAKNKAEFSTAELTEIYKEFYKHESFVKVLEEGNYPEVKAVAGSNYCHVGLEVDQRCGRVIVVSAIDNLVKGASGQAIQNMNLMCGFKETEGLESVGLFP